MDRLLVRFLVLFTLATCAIATSGAKTRLKNAPHSGAVPDHCVQIQDGEFRSVALDREMKYRVLLPCYYQTGSERFPVLYLLHGLYGDYLNWDTRTNLEHYAEKYGLVVVMPDAGDSWYTNSATASSDKFEDYIAKDLIAEIDAKFRTLHSRNSRGIAGLSMGGYGALKIALRYPNDFAFAGSLSGALNAPLDLGDRRPEFRDQLLKVFGPIGSAVRADNNIFTSFQNADKNQLPFLYLACGSSDNLLTTNREFVAQLSSRGAHYEYHETDGDHGWDYWDRAAQDLLRSVAATISVRSN